MTTDARKAMWKVNAVERRERIIGEGGKLIQVLLEKPAAAALDELQHSGDKPRSKTDVISSLLVASAGKLKRRSAKGGARSK